MLTLPEAQDRILARLTPLPAEWVALADAGGRVLRETVRSPLDLPRFDNSAMDGYAVRSEDLAAATRAQPVRLERTGVVEAGSVFSGAMRPGTCVRVFTGARLPAGADAVVMQEDTATVPGPPTAVWFQEPVRPGEFVRARGEDIHTGQTLAPAGARLTTGPLALLGAVGIHSVLVGRRPLVALLATGSELKEPGAALGPGEIYESNRIPLARLCARAGASPRLQPLVPDQPATLRAALRQAFAEADAVVTSGGVSVGETDWVKQALADLGGELDFWRVAIKPGKPFAFGQWAGKPLFGLPGNPVSALVTFWLLVAPALARLQGATDASLPTQAGVLAEPLANGDDRPHFFRVAVQGDQVRSAGRQASHALSSLSVAQGLVEVPPHATLSVGSLVRVWAWE